LHFPCGWVLSFSPIWVAIKVLNMDGCIPRLKDEGGSKYQSQSHHLGNIISIMKTCLLKCCSFACFAATSTGLVQTFAMSLEKKLQLLLETSRRNEQQLCHVKHQFFVHCET